MSHPPTCSDCGTTTDGEHECPPPEDTIWWLTDSMSNGRWLFVDHPTRDGIPVEILRVYVKFLDSAEARAMAKALLQAADEEDARPPAPPPTGPVYQTSGTTALVVPVTFPNPRT